MNPVAADASASAILEGYRRAMARSESIAAQEPRDTSLTLTEIVENATEHAQGLAPRLAGTGERIDRKV
ncbi:hypothetical protein IZ6_03000 [Terrihabitans soli]|uniref:Uncharacterized protein n=1 Tax=Terrihabitans soli TaxID=708113 RepID=A0A6S6QP50_9HYPH|nr:hypothetical protein [Terrihabitans soli]BCJ89565.1 hypothetical protein IZ6_03000 [Terrihabitans soli]